MKVNFAKSIYIVLITVLASGVFFLVARSQFVLTFQENNDLLNQADEILSITISKGELTAKEGGTLYCIAFSSSDEASLKLKANAEKTLDHMKLHTVGIDRGFATG